jgi:hypothetical protein
MAFLSLVRAKDGADMVDPKIGKKYVAKLPYICSRAVKVVPRLLVRGT